MKDLGPKLHNAILIQQCLPAGGYEPMLELTRARNEEYCAQHAFDLQIVIDEVIPDPYGNGGAWAKVELIRQALARGYEYIVWLDADALIWDRFVNLRDGCPKGIGACYHRIPQLNHWNVGVLYLQHTAGVWDFVNEWLGHHEDLMRDDWFEQGIFNHLGQVSRIVQTVSDRWNATLNVNMVPDAVVLGFHGCGNAESRLRLMQRALDLEAKKGVSHAQPSNVSPSST